jgi:hypothetical protein
MTDLGSLSFHFQGINREKQANAAVLKLEPPLILYCLLLGSWVEKPLLFTKLQEQGFAAADPNPAHTERGVEEAAADERAGSIDHGSALGDNSGGSTGERAHYTFVVEMDGQFFLTRCRRSKGNGDSRAFEAQVNDNSLRAESATKPGAGLFDSPETAIDSTILALSYSSNGCHDINNSPETTPRSQLAEQGTSTSNLHPHTPSSRLSSEPLHDSISTEGSRRARSEAMTPSSSPPLHHTRALPETQ